MPTVSLRLYAGLKDMVGARDLDLRLPEGATVGHLRERLGDEYPAVRAMLSVLVFAVDEEYVPSSHLLREGDHVALIPPVSGGSRCSS